MSEKITLIPVNSPDDCRKMLRIPASYQHGHDSVPEGAVGKITGLQRSANGDVHLFIDTSIKAGANPVADLELQAVARVEFLLIQFTPLVRRRILNYIIDRNNAMTGGEYG